MLEKVKIINVFREVRNAETKLAGWSCPMQIVQIQRQNGTIENRFDNELPPKGHVDNRFESAYNWGDFKDQEVDNCILRDNVPNRNNGSNNWINHEPNKNTIDTIIKKIKNQQYLTKKEFEYLRTSCL